MNYTSLRRSFFSKIFSLILIVTLIMTMLVAPKSLFAQGEVEGLPLPGSMLNLSPAYIPLMLTGLNVHPENPLLIDFIVNTGNSGLDKEQVKEQSSRLIKYFLACLTIPEDNQWVNLSPYEKQRIVPEDLGQTVLGQDMLAQDYLLKQLTASLIYPEKNLGRNFWDKVYSEARLEYGTTQIPVNTFNKVWILPDTAKVYEHNHSVVVVKSHLKVMLDEDYLSLIKHESVPSVNNLGNKIIRQIILPAIEEEVNQGKNFANMRQIYNSMILAVWFKKNLKEALLNQVYADKSKVNGVNVDDPALKERIYQQYIEAYKKGVFNYIKEEVDSTTQETIPRKYFSGGLTVVKDVQAVGPDEARGSDAAMIGDNYLLTGLQQKIDKGMVSTNITFSSNSQQVLDRLAILKTKDEFPVMLGYEIGQKIGMPFKDFKHDDDKFVINFDNGTREGIALTYLIDINGQSVFVQSSDQKINDTVKPILESLVFDNTRLADQGYDFPMTLRAVLDELTKVQDRIHQENEKFALNLKEASDFLLSKESVQIYEVNSNQVTFGIADLYENGVRKIYIQSAFVSRLNHSRDRHSLTRAFVHALYNGTAEEKSFQEFEYARKVNTQEELSKLTGGDYVNFNEGIASLIRIPTNEYQEGQAKLIAKRLKLQIWNMGVLRLNGDTRNIRIRANGNAPELTDSPEDSGNANVLYFPLAANPLHFGQIEAMLRAMVQSKADIGFLRVHGMDDRKAVTGETIEERHDITHEFVAFMREYSKGILEYTDIGRENSLDGESDFINFIKLNAGRKDGILNAFYLVGSDHMHYYAPDYDFRKASSVHEYKAKVKDGVMQSDTLQKFAGFAKHYEVFLRESRVTFNVLFNERDPHESELLPVEVDIVNKLKKEKPFNFVLLRGMNFEGASSTAIREALAGVRSEDALMILPTLAEDAIMGRNLNNTIIIQYNPRFDSDRYRGFLTELSKSIKLLARSKPSETDGPAIVDWRKARKSLLNWLERTERNRKGKEITADAIVKMFNAKSAPLSLENVQAAINAARVIDAKNLTSEDVVLAIKKKQFGIDEPGKEMKSFVQVNPGFVALKDVISYEPLASGVGISVKIAVDDNITPNLATYRASIQGVLLGIISQTFPDKKVNITPIKEGPEGRFWFADLTLNDKAQKVAPDLAQVTPVGGIDLNSSQLRLQSEGERLGISFDPAMIASFKRGDFSGVRFQILDIIPVNLTVLLGLNEDLPA